MSEKDEMFKRARIRWQESYQENIWETMAGFARSELARAEPKWVPIKSDADLPKQDGFYWVSVSGAVFQCHIFTADKCWNGEVKPDAYMPIVKPEPYKL